MNYVENGSAEGKEIENIIITFPTKAMAEKEAPILRYIDYFKIQYLTEKGDWSIYS